MGVLQEFERRLEGAVEGFFARTFRSGLQPVELAKAAQRYIADHQHVSADGVVVPNVLRFAVGTKDHERLATIGSSLARELGEVVARTAAERGWLLRGPVKIRIDRDDDVRVGRYRVQGRVEAVGASVAGRATRAQARPDAGERIDRTQVVSRVPTGTARLIVRSGETAGEEIPMAGNRLSVGRLSSCAVTLRDTSVSREHAAFVRRGDMWWVVDLGSTNGTSVNGVRTAEHPVEPGDVVEFGGVSVEFVEA